MSRLRHVGMWTLGLGLAVGIGGVALAQIVIQGNVQIAPQPLPDAKDGPKKDGQKSSQFSAVKLIENSTYRQYINVARDSIKDKAWNDACTALQKILDTQEDYYVQVREKDNQGREVLRWTSVKFEAQNLLGSMPDEGLDVYETRYGGRALAALKEAKDTGNRELLADVAAKWFHTRAGIEANDLLATSLLDRGQYFLAALRFDRAMKLTATRFQPSDLTLFKAALAYRRALETKKAGDLWQKLEERLQDKAGLRVGENTIELAKLRTVYTDEKLPIPVGVFDWPMIRGDLANNAQASGSAPLLERPLWKREMLLDNDPSINEDRYKDFERPVKAQLDTLLSKDTSAVTMPGFFPITTNGKLVFRSYGELRCVALNDDHGVKAGETLWRSSDMRGSLNQILKQKEPDEDLRDIVLPWLNMYSTLAGAPGFANFIFENSTIGAISTDHQYVYAIDDLAIPPPDNLLQPNPMWQFQPMPPANVPAKIKPLIMQNCLSAYSVQNGKAKWELGSVNPKDPKDEFSDSHFLGAPISIGGRLYVLNEKHTGQQGDAELRLVCINPNVVNGSKPQIVAPIQTLGSVDQRNRVTHAVSRRVNAVHLAYGEGILVCPTNAGEVLGVDLISRSLAWAYPYREHLPTEAFSGNDINNMHPNIRFGNRFPNNSSLASGTVTLTKWKSTPPAVVDGKIVFTAPDADSLHCINLHDGTPRWKVARHDGDIYFGGVFNKKAIVVGKNHIRALNLDDGRQLWSITTGDVPSGQGVASHGVFYQPLKRGEILAVDLERGAIKAHNRSKDSSDKVGNLVFSDGAVISLTPYEVKAFPQLIARLEVADAAVKNDPLNGVKLVTRGEILLANGQVQKAVNDLQIALKQTLPEPVAARAKTYLYEALTDLLLLDFNTASTKYLDEYRELCQLGASDHERQMRQAKFYRIVGNGREAQGDLIEAFKMYKEFGSLPIHREEKGVASLEDPAHKVPVDVWLRGRVSAMFARATPEQRAPLEAKIAQEWKAVEAKNDVDAIRAFVGMFDVAFDVGREARLRLADAILEGNEKNNFLEAELNLYQLRGNQYRAQPASGGKALAGLARLEEKRGSAESMQAASIFYRELAREFPINAVRGDKTGKDLFNDLAADKRLLPFLEESSSFWSESPIAARDLSGIGGNINMQQQTQHNVLHPDGETSPFLQRHRLTLQTNINGLPPKLTLTDLSSGKNRWGPLELSGHPANVQMVQIYQQQPFGQNANAGARYRYYQSVGHLAVVQMGVMVYCIDADQGKALWQQPLLDNGKNNPVAHAQLVLDGEGNLDLLTYNQNGQQQSRKAVGQIGAVQANYVALVGSQGLQVLDPLRGNVLWKKADVPANSRVFGDDQYIFVVEMGEGGASATRVLRASDGEPVAAPAFMGEFQNRQHVFGRNILVSERGQSLRLYDIVTGKTLWKKTFEPQSTLCITDDPKVAGWIDPKGQLVAIDVSSGAEILNTSVVQGRVGMHDVAALRDPLLLVDADRVYVALNHAIEPRVGGSVIGNNFQNALRSRLVNGYVMAFHRHDGPAKMGRKTVDAKKGGLAWHSDRPIENQMLVTEQFEQMPILLFTSRYHKMMPNGGATNVSTTIALHKQTGKVPYDSGPRPTFNTFFPHFVNLQVDPRQGTINMIGQQGSIQFYVDDGRKVDPPAGLNVSQAGSIQEPIPQPVRIRPNVIQRQMIVPPAQGNFP